MLVQVFSFFDCLAISFLGHISQLTGLVGGKDGTSLRSWRISILCINHFARKRLKLEAHGVDFSRIFFQVIFLQGFVHVK